MAALFRFSDAWTARLNGGTGYKAPTEIAYLNEERDLGNYSSPQYARMPKLVAEQSLGVNADVNFYRRFKSGFRLTVNQSFFHTTLAHPVYTTHFVVLNPPLDLTLTNAAAPIITAGTQTYVQASYKAFEAYIGYIFADVHKSYDALVSETYTPRFLATPRHNFSATFFYTLEHRWRVGVESSRIGETEIENGAKSPAYWLFAFSVRREFTKHFSATLNNENLFDVRQVRYSPVYTGGIARPYFNALYAPLDGRVINLALQFKF